MSKVTQTPDELRRHLSDSVDFLEASCVAFDQGRIAEAKRLATTIRVLLHDTVNSKSLLGLLALKGQLRYFDTTLPDLPGNLLSYHGLVGFGPNAHGHSYWSFLGTGPVRRELQPLLLFEDWWEQVVIDDRAGGKFTRKSLVLALANTDGGAHVDPELNASYSALTRGNSLGWVFNDGDKDTPLSDVELYSVRQISYELTESLSAAGIVAA